MAPRLNQYYVAYIDLLGFSELVREDCQSTRHKKNLDSLHRVHIDAPTLLRQEPEDTLIQFSDSIVFSRVFKISKLQNFLYSVSQLQKNLLLVGYLCRGGITFGKHFSNNSFIFSKALIDAYEIEKNRSKYPRIVVSSDLIELYSQYRTSIPSGILREDDNEYFIDYLKPVNNSEKQQLSTAVQSIVSNSYQKNTSVLEKLRWLSRYSDHVLGTSLSKPQFA